MGPGADDVAMFLVKLVLDEVVLATKVRVASPEHCIRKPTSLAGMRIFGMIANHRFVKLAKNGPGYTDRG